MSKKNKTSQTNTVVNLIENGHWYKISHMKIDEFIT